MHVSGSGARAQDLHVSLCAVLMAEACNIGREPLINHNIPALTRHRLSWVKKNYLRAETLVSAKARLTRFSCTCMLQCVYNEHMYIKEAKNGYSTYHPKRQCDD